MPVHIHAHAHTGVCKGTHKSSMGFVVHPSSFTTHANYAVQCLLKVTHYLHLCTYGRTHTHRVKRINLGDQSIVRLGAVTKGEHVANTFPVSICGQTQSLIKIHTEPVLLWWVGKMLHQDVVTTRLSPPTGMYLPHTVLPHAWTAQWQAPL